MRNGLDQFTLAYVGAALWSSTDDDGQPLDKNFSLASIADEALQKMIDDCAKFQADNFDQISDDLSQAGHDFWLTRNYHGAGFWDGDWPEHGDALTIASHAFAASDLYIGDDGMLYLM